MTAILGGFLWFVLGMGHFSFLIVLGSAFFFAGCIFLLQQKRRNKHTPFSYMDCYAEQSGLKEVSPVIKCTIALIGIFCAVGGNSLLVSVVIFFLMMGYTIGLGKVNIFVYFGFLLVPVTFLGLSSFALLFDFSRVRMGVFSIPFFDRYLVMTEVAQTETSLLMAKALAAVSSLYGLSLSTPLYEIMGVLKKAKVPTVVMELMYLMIRYLYVLTQILEEMKQAAKSRMGMVGWKNTYRTVGYLMTHLLLVSFRRASDSFDAMESRCYMGKIDFLEQERKATAKQWFMVFCYGMVLIGFIAVKRR